MTLGVRGARCKNQGAVWGLAGACNGLRNGRFTGCFTCGICLAERCASKARPGGFASWDSQGATRRLIADRRTATVQRLCRYGCTQATSKKNTHAHVSPVRCIALRKNLAQPLATKDACVEIFEAARVRLWGGGDVPRWSCCKRCSARRRGPTPCPAGSCSGTTGSHGPTDPQPSSYARVT